MKFPRLFLAMLAVSILSVTASFAHQGATGVVKQRMMLMKEIKKDMKRVKRFASAKNPGDNQDLKKLLASLKSSTRKIPALFPKDSLQHPSEARAEIWTDWPEFEKLALELEDGFERLEQSLLDEESQSIEPNLKRITKTCSSCHDRFREEE